MPRIDCVVETDTPATPRMLQLSAMFDAPISEKSRLSWAGDFPYDEEDWNVGLIVGPSGSGKSTILREVFGDPTELEWGDGSVVDSFARHLSITDVSSACDSVGFNTIPAWMRPYRVLSNGEKFRVTLARLLLEGGDPIIVDEFTSVVDRQVAQIGSHSVQKFVRANNRKLVAASCHYDIVDWLQPDWIFEPGTMSFRRRRLRQRPEINCEIQRVDYSAWKLFAPFHYLTSNLHRNAACFVLFVNGEPASFAGTLHFMHPKVRNITTISRLVTLPDWQGLGLALRLSATLGAAYRGIGRRLRAYPAHPALIRSFAKRPEWRQTHLAGHFKGKSTKGEGGRICATFEYTAEAMDENQARAFIDG